MSNQTYTIGDRSHDGLLEITDTFWDSNGSMRVTVRELVGQRWTEYPYPVLERARRLAKRTLGNIKTTRLENTWYANGCSHATFTVSRLDLRA